MLTSEQIVLYVHETCDKLKTLRCKMNLLLIVIYKLQRQSVLFYQFIDALNCIPFLKEKFLISNISLANSCFERHVAYACMALYFPVRGGGGPIISNVHCASNNSLVVLTKGLYCKIVNPECSL